MVVCFLEDTHRTRKKLDMCTYTWVCVHVCAGVHISIHKMVNYIQAGEVPSYVERDTKELSQRRNGGCERVLGKTSPKTALSQSEEYYFLPDICNSLQILPFIFSPWKFHAFCLLMPNYFSWARDLVCPHQTPAWWCCMFLIISGCLLSIQDDLKLDPTLPFKFYFSFYPLANHSLILGKPYNVPFQVCVMLFTLPLSPHVSPHAQVRPIQDPAQRPIKSIKPTSCCSVDIIHFLLWASMVRFLSCIRGIYYARSA